MQVREFQSVIGRETRKQCVEKWGGLPDIVMACVGGGSNAIGIFNEFIDEDSVSAPRPPLPPLPLPLLRWRGAGLGCEVGLEGQLVGGLVRVGGHRCYGGRSDGVAAFRIQRRHTLASVKKVWAGPQRQLCADRARPAACAAGAPDWRGGRR